MLCLVTDLLDLVTGLLDVEEYPTLDLACAYPLRWGCETVVGHHKTDMEKASPSCAPATPRA